MHRRILSIILTAALVWAGGARCLVLDKSGTNDIAALLSVLGSNYYLFLSDQPNGGSPRSLLTYSTDGSLQLKTWTGGPANIARGVVAKGIIFAIDGATNDTIWISRDKGSTWESWVNPSPQSSTFQGLAACDGTVMATYGTMAYSAGTNPKGYYSSDQGSTFSSFFVPSGATSSPSVTGLDCNTQYAFITVAQGNRLYRAALSDLSSWSQPSDFGSASYPSSYSDPVASTSGLVVFAPITTLYLDYSTDQAATLHGAGGFPISVVRLSGGADFGGGSYYLGIVDSSATNRCHIYESATGSENPQTSMTKVQLNCGTSSDLGIPAVYADDNRVLAAYRYNSAAATGLFVSSDQGSSFQSVDLSSVWNSSGYITSIAKDE